MPDHPASTFRRQFLIAAGLAATAPAWSAPALALPGASPARRAAARFAYVGSYTTPRRNGRGTGLSAFRIDPATEQWEPLQVVASVNPSFLTRHPVRPFIYVAHGDEDYLSTVRYDEKTGLMTLLGETFTGGTNGVHSALSPSGRHLLSANFETGTVAVMPVGADGVAGKLAQLVDLNAIMGKTKPAWDGRLSYDKSHPHQIVFDPSGNFFMVPDKGIDRVFTFAFDDDTGRIDAHPGMAIVRDGEGPRHCAFHQTLPIAWVLNETGSSIVTYAVGAPGAAPRPLQRLDAIPESFAGQNGSAELAVLDDRFLYLSNRGSDDVGVFAIDAKGMLRPLAWTKTGGLMPRFITLDPQQKYLYACNEDSDNTTRLRVDHRTGLLTATDWKVTTPSAVSLVFA